MWKQLGAAGAAFFLWSQLELKRFRVTPYRLVEASKEKCHVLVLSDLHGKQFGKNNIRLYQAIKRRQPQVIICAGDMISCLCPEEFFRTEKFISSLCSLAPVYYGIGNHEKKLMDPNHPFSEEYKRYEHYLKKAGVTFLKNQTVYLEQAGLWLSGLDIPLEYYEKKVRKILPVSEVKRLLPDVGKEGHHVMIAHNPAYGETYAKTGADLILSGHTHGGLVRIPGIGSLLSPELLFHPKYDAGKFQIDESTLIVSKGLGTHTFHIRIFDRAEILDITI